MIDKLHHFCFKATQIDILKMCLWNVGRRVGYTRKSPVCPCACSHTI